MRETVDFWLQQNSQQQQSYINLLQLVGGLSRLFSNASEPYLYYRIAEKIFCRAFEASDHSRSDIAVDASKHRMGIGLKTFLQPRNTSYQKIAEFNESSEDIRNLNNSPIEIVRLLSELYNERIQFAQNTTGVEQLIYHCVLRKKDQFILCEYPINPINLTEIQVSNNRQSTSVNFNVGDIRLRYVHSKSTLYREFALLPSGYPIPIKIYEDPFHLLETLYANQITVVESTYPSVILPLYSVRDIDNPFVPEHSGLNQWNANGRERNEDEVYISIPRWIHTEFSGFFPRRDVPFELRLPNQQTLQAKVCQDNDKALMTNPNRALGQWILRDVLQVQPHELVTYDHLKRRGVDSVEIIKHGDREFEVAFKKLGAYQDFHTKYNQ